MCKKYKGYGDTEYESMESFVLKRVRMDAPNLGGSSCPALDYTWSVLDGGRARNPTMAERAAFEEMVVEYCHDCGNERADELYIGPLPVVFGCGHLAHVECHAPQGLVSCRYRNTEGASEYEEVNPA